MLTHVLRLQANLEHKRQKGEPRAAERGVRRQQRARLQQRPRVQLVAVVEVRHRARRGHAAHHRARVAPAQERPSGTEPAGHEQGLRSRERPGLAEMLVEWMHLKGMVTSWVAASRAAADASGASVRDPTSGSVDGHSGIDEPGTAEPAASTSLITSSAVHP